jgi:ribonuclease HII
MMIIGIDEAGRGPLAGPVVAGAVVLPPAFNGAGLTDSKKLTARQRDHWYAEITTHARWAVGLADVAEIESLNILQASLLAMRRAVENLLSPPPAPIACAWRKRQALGATSPERGEEKLPLPLREGIEGRGKNFEIWVDGNQNPKFENIPPARVKCFVGGDALHAPISAASVIAKVTRDRMMHELHAQYPHYGWNKNMGYGTAPHRAAIITYGATPHHRALFLRKIYDQHSIAA